MCVSVYVCVWGGWEGPRRCAGRSRREGSRGGSPVPKGQGGLYGAGTRAWAGLAQALEGSVRLSPRSRGRAAPREVWVSVRKRPRCVGVSAFQTSALCARPRGLAPAPPSSSAAGVQRPGSGAELGPRAAVLNPQAPLPRAAHPGDGPDAGAGLRPQQCTWAATPGPQLPAPRGCARAEAPVQPRPAVRGCAQLQGRCAPRGGSSKPGCGAGGQARLPAVRTGVLPPPGARAASPRGRSAPCAGCGHSRASAGGGPSLQPNL